MSALEDVKGVPPLQLRRRPRPGIKAPGFKGALVSESVQKRSYIDRWSKIYKTDQHTALSVCLSFSVALSHVVLVSNDFNTMETIVHRPSSLISRALLLFNCNGAV